MDQEDASIIEKVLISKISKKYTFKKLFAFWMYVPKRNGDVAQPLLQTFSRVVKMVVLRLATCKLQVCCISIRSQMKNAKK